MPLTVPNAFAAASGNVPASQLDGNNAAITNWINARNPTSGLLAARPAFGNAGALYFATDVAGGTIYLDTGTAWTALQAPGAIALTPGATVTIDASTGFYFTLVPTASFTLANPLNPTHGQKIIVRIKQDGVGGRVITYGAAWSFGSDISSAVLSTGANKVDYIGAIYDSVDAKWNVVAFVRGY
jgi:hypothetical protein